MVLLAFLASAAMITIACQPRQIIITPGITPGISPGAASLEMPGTNTALGCVSAAWHKPPEHGEYFEAWKHVQAGTRAIKEFTLAGHGDRGVLCAGLEDACWNDFGNGSIYTIDLEALKRYEGDVTASRGNISILRLVGCKVGAGPDGAALVKRVAILLNAEVSATMCDVECDNGLLSMAEGCGWYTATPTLTPAPIDSAPIMITPYTNAQLFVGGQSVTVDLKKLTVSEIALTSLTSRGVRAITPTPPQQQILLAGIGLNRPRRMHGRYLARRAARITLTFASPTEKGLHPSKTKHLIVLNWEHAVDEDDQSVVYDVDRRLKAVVEAF